MAGIPACWSGMRGWLMLLLAMVATGAVFAAPVAGSGVVVKVWQSQDGLPSNVVRSVVQADDGYLWVATAEGIARFDGFDFELIEEDEGLRQHRLAYSRLFTTPGGGVWVATFQGGLLRVVQGRIQPILDDSRRPNPPLVTQLLEDAAGTVFCKRGEETLEIGTHGAALPVVADDKLKGWFAADLNRSRETGRRVDPDRPPELSDQAGRRWTATVDGGLTLSEGGRPRSAVEFPQRGRLFGVNEMLLDREGSVWVASPVSGLARLRPARVHVPQIDAGSSEQAFSALLEDRSGVWWIANRRGGLIRWTPEESRHIEFSTSRLARPAGALFEDRDGRLWVASRDGTVFLREDGTFLPQFLKTQVPSKVRSITQDAAGTLWFGGAQGLASFGNGRVRRFGRDDGLGELDLTLVQVFPGGRIIAGSTTGAVVLGDERGFGTFASPGTMGHHWISGIRTVSADEVWVSTQGGGLWLWHGGKWRGFGADDGLPDSRLTCLLDDGRGFFWLGSLGGIIRVERRELLARLRNPEAEIHWLRLDHTDGLPSRECLGGYQPAGWRARDGQLWFPTGGGLVRLRPDLVVRNEVPPPVYLQAVRANGVAQPVAAGPVTPPPGRARLEFRFVGLSLDAPEKTTYRARLRGLDDSWRELGNQRIAAFEAVPPGRYTFEVVAVNGDGTRSLAPAGIAVVIPPHFWETTWFYLSAGVVALAAAGGVGWFGARSRLKRRIQALKIRNAREAERARIARDLHDDLGAHLTEISMLAALAAEDAVQTPLHGPLDQLAGKAKHIVTSLDEIVWAVNPREDSLRSLIEYLAAFAREFLDLARLTLRVDIEGGIPDLPLASAKRHGVFLAAREALNNIVKHAAASEVRLRVVVDDGALAIHLEDNGCGYDPAAITTGNGLENLRTRMREAGGDCRIDAAKGRGTTVCLSLPLSPGV